MTESLSPLVSCSVKWGNNSAFLQELSGEFREIREVKCLVHNKGTVSGIRFTSSPTCSVTLGSLGPSLLSCVTQGISTFLGPLNRTVENQRGAKPWVGAEGGLYRAEVLDSTKPQSCQAFFRACSEPQGPDVPCLGLLQAFRFPAGPCRHFS